MPRIPAPRRFVAILLIPTSLLLVAFSLSAQNPSSSPEKGCAECHAEIFRNYSETTMAKASGAAIQALIPGEFTHTASGVHYRIYRENSKAWLSFDRNAGESLDGKRELLYFVGSGQRGRTYLFSDDGYPSKPRELVRAKQNLGHDSRLQIRNAHAPEPSSLCVLPPLPHQRKSGACAGYRQ